jgi:hypothetical protein
MHSKPLYSTYCSYVTQMYRPKTFDPPWIDFFTSSCPYYVNHYTKFTLFPILPKELQLLIWSFVETESLHIHISSGVKKQKERKYSKTPFCRIAKYKTPALLHACYDSRMEALKTYRLVFAAQLGHPVYFNFKDDSLVFRSIGAVQTFIRSTPKFGASPEHLGSVRHLVLHRHGTIHLSDLRNTCRYFGGLKRLSVIYQVIVCGSHRVDPFPWIINPKEGTWLWDPMRDYIMAAIPGGRGDLKTWKPPMLKVGSAAQWTAQRLHDIAGGDPMEWSYTVVIPALDFTPLSGRVDLAVGRPMIGGSGSP